MLGFLIFVPLLLGFSRLSCSQNLVQCVTFCSQGKPSGPAVDCPSSSPVMGLPSDTCACAGPEGGVIQCLLCAVGITTIADARAYCHDGPASTATSSSSSTTTSSGSSSACPSVTPEPTYAAGQTISDNLLILFDDAARLASMAYCISETVTSPFTCTRFCCAENHLNLEYYFNPILTGGLRGFIARDEDPNNKRIIISFMGTSLADPRTILVDLGVPARKYTVWTETIAFVNSIRQLAVPITGIPDLSKCSGCKLHRGFLSYATTALDVAKQKIVELHKIYPCYKIEVVGHSLGGAVAEIVGTTLVQLGMYVTIATLASPRVGNDNWAAFTDQAFSAPNRFYRLTRTGDLIVDLPAQFSGFQHPENEFWITSDPPVLASAVTSCAFDENPACADSSQALLYTDLGFVVAAPALAIALAVAAFANPLLAPVLTVEEQLLYDQTAAIVKGFWSSHVDYIYNAIGNCTIQTGDPC